MNRRGFTVIEVIIVVTIMGILLILGVVNLRGSQISARDAERKGDIEAIATHLELYYNSGNYELGRAPGSYISSTTGGGTNAGILAIVRDMDPKSLVAPGHSDLDYISFTPATCSGVCTQTPAGVTPQPTIDQYVYQPLQSDGTLCTNISQGCRKFNLYYRLEADDTVYMVTSKNQ